MDNLRLTQLAVSEFKVDSVTEFCLNSHGNTLILWGNCFEFNILEMLYSVELLIPLPYLAKHVAVSQNKPLTKLIKPVDLVKIYSKSNVLECQALSLDPIYVTECSLEPPKPRLLQTELVGEGPAQICCMLNTFGACDLLKKDYLTNDWNLLKTNLNKILITDVFPIKISPKDIKNFKDFQNFIDIYLITSFAWSEIGDYNVIYVGNALGYVVSLKYLPETQEFQKLFKLKTSLERIAYMTIKDKLVLVACPEGQIRLLKIDTVKMKLIEMECLWSKKDRMTCRKAFISYCEQLQSYFIVFSKGAHILAYRLNANGQLMSNCTLYVSGIKISAIDIITPLEFAVTTIMSTITHIRLVCPSDEELSIESQTIQHDMDSTNLQILGIAISKSRNLWSFLLSRNKDYTHQSKYMPNSTFLSVSKISNQDILTKLINLNLTTMDMARDLVLAINLDIVNNMETERYSEFLNLTRLNCPKVLNEAFLQKLQIKLLIVRNFAKYQKMKYKSFKRHTELELNFLECIVPLVYILLRLQYLQTVRTPEVKLSSFQELSVACMQSQFSRLINGLANNDNDDNPLRNSLEHFIKVASDEFDKCKFETESFKYKPETCSICNEGISVTTLDKCREGHEVKRCTISYVKLPLFQTRYCPHCFALAADDSVDLQELFPPNEFLKCSFCRFLLKEDKF